MNGSAELGRLVKGRAKELGFDLVGIAAGGPSDRLEYFRRWLDMGCQGEMRWLEARFAERTDPQKYLPGAQSVICVGANYHVPLADVAGEAKAGRGRVARYALGDDYHQVLRDRLYVLADWLRQVSPGALTRVCVDTAPVMEKELAARSGVGWIGKNTCLINQSLGSWLVLGEILTTLQLPPDQGAPDRCGTCRKCIEACPTGAITGEYQLDARKCISYLTIERRQPLGREEGGQIGQWLFGCDICQEVCPWNRGAPVAQMAELRPRFASGTLELRKVLGWDQQDYRRELRKSAIKRVKLPLLQHNARLVGHNTSSEKAAP